MDRGCARSLTGCAAIVAVLYGIAAFIAGMHGVVIYPCNRYADANVTGCGPAPNFGDYVFNITYVDDGGARHDGGSIVSSTIACTPGVLEQHVRVCYPLRDRDAFRNDKVGFADPVVAPALLYSAIPALVGGAFVFCVLGCRSGCDQDRRRRSYGPDCIGDGAYTSPSSHIIPMGFVNSTGFASPMSPAWSPPASHSHH